MTATLAIPVAADATAGQMPALEMLGLRKSFGPTEIIRGIDLSVAKGERHAVIGPNGAGKSTLFNLVSGLMAPSAGEVRLNGAGHQRPAGLPHQSPRPFALLPGDEHLPTA